MSEPEASEERGSPPGGRRPTKGGSLVFATRNAGKLREASEILGAAGFVIAGAAELDLPDVEETGATFEENALLKADSAAKISGLPALGDDSGLEVDALDGRPGVLSARYGGPGLDDAGRRAKLLAELRDVPDARRTARFVCAVALVTPGGETRITRGVCAGRILREERGTGGFGYDRLFAPEGQTLTFGELPAETKHALSHRGRALAIVRTWLRPD
jgi:XTP/dITP diphosphohydrolase